MPDPASLAQRIRDLRQGKGLSVFDLAKAAGTTAQTIYNLENGAVQDPRLSLLQRLATALDTSLYDLTGS